MVKKIYAPRSGVIFPLQAHFNGLIFYLLRGLKTFETTKDAGSHVIEKSGIRRI